MPGAVKNYDQKVILWKIEATEGTDAAPASPTDALRVLNYRPTFMDADKRVRNIEKGYQGANPVALTSIKRGASFDMEMHGGGVSAGTTVPPWMKVLRCAGLDAGVVTGGNSVKQTPISNSPTVSIPSATSWAYIDDALLKTIGARCAVGFRIEDDEWPMFMVTMLGRAPTTLFEQAAPASVVPPSGYIDPVLCSSENTTFTWLGFSPALRRWEMNSNSENQYRSLIGPQDRINQRNRDWNGSIVMRVPDLTAKDYFAGIRPGTTGAASAVHGTVAGNIVQIDTPALQVTGNVDFSEEGGELMATFPVTALPVTGNDEITFTSK
jgi:hypothetical protein